MIRLVKRPWRGDPKVLKRPLTISTVLFLSGAVVGAVTPAFITRDDPDSVLTSFVPEQQGSEFLEVLFNNVTVVVMLATSGFLLGALTVFILIANGVLIGALLSPFSSELTERVLLVAPHGVFEITGFVLAGTAGFLLPVRLYEVVQSQNEGLFETRFLAL